VGVFDFLLLRAKKERYHMAHPLAVAGLVGVLELLFLDLVFDLVRKLVPSCDGVGCAAFPSVLSLLIGLINGSNLSMSVFFLSHSLPMP